MRIHPAAVVSPGAVIHPNVEIGPFCCIESGAVLGQGCKLTGQATVKANTIVGRDTTICEGAVLGGYPQHISPPANPGRVVVGERCIIREHVTIHRSMNTEGETRIGNECLLMVGAHVAHDCRVGNRVTLTNDVLLGGHVQVGDRAVLGGAAVVHQHCRVGRLAMIGGRARVIQDVPPFVMTDGETAQVVGLNRIGLQRAGVTVAEQLQLKAAFRLIYRRGLSFEETIAAIEREFPLGPASEFAEFFRGSKRGFVQSRRAAAKHAAAVIRLIEPGDDDGEAAEFTRRAG